MPAMKTTQQDRGDRGGQPGGQARQQQQAEGDLHERQRGSDHLRQVVRHHLVRVDRPPGAGQVADLGRARRTATRAASPSRAAVPIHGRAIGHRWTAGGHRHAH